MCDFEWILKAESEVKLCVFGGMRASVNFLEGVFIRPAFC